MCGIVGKIANNITSEDVSEVIRMRDSMSHRGPDAFGVYKDENCVLGHRRLAIIDLSDRGKQPMSSSDGRFTIIYNGEVYNYLDIKRRLKRNYKFNSNTDTEVILYSYIEYGPSCLDHFNGMFAMAIWDNFKKELFLARDRLGQKPLYYYRSDTQFYFASELRAFKHLRNIELKKSLEGINQFLALGYTLSPKTIYENLLQLEAGNYLVVKESGSYTEQKKYWFYENYFKSESNEKTTNNLSNIVDLLDSSVKRRMMSDVPLGSFLSGGIDSSIISYLLKKNSNNHTHTFSIGFGVSDYDESKDALKVANELNTIHSEKKINEDDYNFYFDFGIKNMDGLLADNSYIPMLAVSKLASEKVKVVLSGDGGDELFGGYITYKSDLLHQYSSYIPDQVLKLISKRKQVNRHKKVGMDFKVQQFAYGSQFDYKKAHYSWRLIFRPEERIKILGSEYKELIYDTDPFLIFEDHYRKVSHLEIMDQHFYVDAMTWLTDDILVKVDRSSMLFSIEARAPFLDKEVVQFTAGLNWQEKIDLFNSKKILKEAFRSLLPGFIFKKKKSGFNFPISNYIENKHFNEFQDYCAYLFRRKIYESQ